LSVYEIKICQKKVAVLEDRGSRAESLRPMQCVQYLPLRGDKQELEGADSTVIDQKWPTSVRRLKE
jgi:hypothetical protein